MEKSESVKTMEFIIRQIEMKSINQVKDILRLPDRQEAWEAFKNHKALTKEDMRDLKVAFDKLDYHMRSVHLMSLVALSRVTQEIGSYLDSLMVEYETKADGG